MVFPPVSCYFFSLITKYSLRYPILKHNTLNSCCSDARYQFHIHTKPKQKKLNFVYFIPLTPELNPELSIYQKALGTLPEDGNVMPKHVGATIHN
jgi:hypothetical protein